MKMLLVFDYFLHKNVRIFLPFLQKVSFTKMFLVFVLFLVQFPFNEDFKGFFFNMYKNNITNITASGSRYCWNPDLKDDVLTKPQNAIDPNEKLEWCSNFNKSKNDRPWLKIDFQKSSFIPSSYTIQSGCCIYSTCCCKIYSWSFEGSNDNNTWTTLHREEQNYKLDYCTVQHYHFQNTQSFKYIRIIQDEPQPGCWYCMDIARLELFGKLENSDYFSNEDDDMEEISIIGKVSK